MRRNRGANPGLASLAAAVARVMARKSFSCPHLRVGQPGDDAREERDDHDGHRRHQAGRRRAAVTLAIHADVACPVMPCSTKRLKPTGGVICAISTTSTMKMPNQIEVEAGLGAMIGSTTAHGQHDHADAIEKAAQHQVEQRQRHQEDGHGVRGPARRPTRPAGVAWPVKAMVLVRKAAPARMNMIMQLQPRRADAGCPRSCASSGCRRPGGDQPASPARRTPAAHSVAVAQPLYHAAQTMKPISSTDRGSGWPERRSFSRISVVGGSGGGTRRGVAQRSTRRCSRREQQHQHRSAGQEAGDEQARSR